METAALRSADTPSTDPKAATTFEKPIAAPVSVHPSITHRPKPNPRRIVGQIGLEIAAFKIEEVAKPGNVTEVPALITQKQSNPFDVSTVKSAAAVAKPLEQAASEKLERPLQSPGLGDEALLAVQSARAAGKETTPTKAAQHEVGERDRRFAMAQRSEVATSSPTTAGTTSTRTPRRLAALSVRPTSPDTKPAEFYGLHLGTFLDPRKALRGWQHIYRSHEDVLGGLQPRIRRYDLGAKGVRYRLRVVPFVDEKAASAICDRLERGKFCRVTLE